MSENGHIHVQFCQFSIRQRRKGGGAGRRVNEGKKLSFTCAERPAIKIESIPGGAPLVFFVFLFSFFSPFSRFRRRQTRQPTRRPTRKPLGGGEKRQKRDHRLEASILATSVRQTPASDDSASLTTGGQRPTGKPAPPQRRPRTLRPSSGRRWQISGPLDLGRRRQRAPPLSSRRRRRRAETVGGAQ